MASQSQIEANRRNALKSTGPTSATGKAASSMNALKTGIDARSAVLPTENPAELDQLTEDYYRSHPPASPEARALVDELIHCEWLLRRLRTAESQAWQYQSDDKFRDPPKYPLGQSATYNSSTFAKLQNRLDSNRRAWHRSHQALRQLEAAPAPAPTPEPPPGLTLVTPSPQTTSHQIGFVPANPSPAPPQPAPETVLARRIPLPAASLPSRRHHGSLPCPPSPATPRQAAPPKPGIPPDAC